MSEELKPCPFCGNKCEHTPRVHKGFSPLRLYSWVFCTNCSANGPIRLYAVDAIAAWNLRSEPAGKETK